MHKELKPIHKTSQKRLNGRPKIMGSMRSQSGTEKHIAAKGISAISTARADGFLTTAALQASGLSSARNLV